MTSSVVNPPVGQVRFFSSGQVIIGGDRKKKTYYAKKRMVLCLKTGYNIQAIYPLMTFLPMNGQHRTTYYRSTCGHWESIE